MAAGAETEKTDEMISLPRLIVAGSFENFFILPGSMIHIMTYGNTASSCTTLHRRIQFHIVPVLEKGNEYPMHTMYWSMVLQPTSASIRYARQKKLAL